MKGYIYELSRSTIKGWISDGHGHPIPVALFINGKEYAKAIASEMLPHIKEANWHPTGACGFSFAVAEIDFDPLHDTVAVKVDVEIPLSGKMAAAQFAAIRDSKLGQRQPFFFMHIPKTAGTSFRSMLYRQFEQHEIYPNKKTILGNDGKYPKFPVVHADIQQYYSSINLLTGHYTYDMGLQLLGTRMIPIVFFRDPIERCISALYQQKKMKPKYADASLEDIFDKEPFQVDNVQCYYMTGDASPSTLTETHVSKAIDRMEALPVFGLAEAFDKSVSLFENEFTWRLGRSKNMNKSKRKTADVNDRLLAKIRASNRFDIQLYKAAAERFSAMESSS